MVFQLACAGSRAPQPPSNSKKSTSGNAGEPSDSVQPSSGMVVHPFKFALITFLNKISAKSTIF